MSIGLDTFTTIIDTGGELTAADMLDISGQLYRLCPTPADQVPRKEALNTIGWTVHKGESAVLQSNVEGELFLRWAGSVRPSNKAGATLITFQFARLRKWP